MLTANCRVCGDAKPQSEFALPECSKCSKVKSDAEAEFRAKNPDAPTSDALYAGRQALNHRAHHANKNFVDPRAFAGANGMIPIPPNYDRGESNG